MANNKQQDDYKKKNDAMKLVAARMNRAAKAEGKKAVEELKKINPDMADLKMSLIPSNVCLPSAQIPFKDVYLKVVDTLASKEGLTKTQKLILEEIQNTYFSGMGVISPNVWTRKLVHWAVTEAQKRLNANMAKPINILGCTSLSEIRIKMLAHQSYGHAVIQYSGKIVINKHHVVAGKKSFKVIERANSYYIQVQTGGGKSQWIRLDSLISLLSNLKQEYL